MARRASATTAPSWAFSVTPSASTSTPSGSSSGGGVRNVTSAGPSIHCAAIAHA